MKFLTKKVEKIHRGKINDLRAKGLIYIEIIFLIYKLKIFSQISLFTGIPSFKFAFLI
jgi:hypothetical protein